ncbi:MAG: porin family protein [Alphaproteobacteria bacterium]
MKTLKMALLSATCLIGAGAFSAANAADIYEPRGVSMKDAPAYSPVENWRGFYIGANAGWASHDDDDVSYCYGGQTNHKCGRIDGDRSGWLAGVHAGYNWQKQDVVFGIEGDIDAGDNLDYLASVRGRAGLAIDRSLIYVTAGVAFAGFGDDDIFADDTQTGWVVGLGIEHKLRPNVSIGLEAMRYSFSDVDKVCCDADELDQDMWTVRARLTYHFNGAVAPLK